METHHLARLSMLGFACQGLIGPILLSLWGFDGLGTAFLVAAASWPVQCLLIRPLMDDGLYPHWTRASFLGAVGGIAILVIFGQSNVLLRPLAWHALILSVFHYTEYLATALTNPANLSTDSFLLNHSTAYHVAAVASWVEFFLELWLLPYLKMLLLPRTIGLAIVGAGEVLRKAAMVHAGVSFNHLVQSEKRQDHVLVTSGAYGLVRHPSYLGWFLWSMGTQVVLCNPICLIGYAVVSWRFFAERIHAEEYSLLQFFGREYKDYKAKVPFSGIPFVRGYDM